MQFIKRNFDIRTFIIALSSSITWILASDYVVDQFISPEYHTTAQSFKGILFVTLLSVLLSVIHGREKYALTLKQEGFNQLFKNSPTPTIIFDLTNMDVLQINQSALGVFKLPYNEASNLKMNTMFEGTKNWQELIRTIDSKGSSKTLQQATAYDRFKNSFEVSLTFGSFNLFDKKCALVYVEKK